MKRRWFVLATAATTLGTALVVQRALGQTSKQPRRVGLLMIGTAATNAKSLQSLRDGLQERGHVEGRDIVIDIRFAADRIADPPRLAADLAALRPAVIVAYGPHATDAVLAAAPEVPIVALLGDFVASGYSSALGRHGGRLTGVSFMSPILDVKRLQLLAELLPKGSVVLNLADPEAPAEMKRSVEDAGRSLGLVLHSAYPRTPAEIEVAFASARRLGAAGINQLTSTFLHSNRARIIELAAGARLPAIYQWTVSAEEGGLMAYGPPLTAMSRQIAGYASRILNGAKPGDLPIEQPTRFELVINLKTAKALGLTIPQSLLLRADEVIQ